MESNGVHELTAAYALDALDEHDEREYEAHLRRCPRCRAELASLREAASALAYGVEPAEPPADLRDRVLRSVRPERENVVAFRRRRVYRASLAVAAAAACLAVGLGLWSASLARSLEREREARVADAAALAVLADPAAESIALEGAKGRLVLSPRGRAALVVADVRPAPDDKTYEVWVIEDRRPRPAGTFQADDGRDLVPLARSVPEGATVAVTLEREGGVDAPTGPPLFSAQT